MSTGAGNAFSFVVALIVIVVSCLRHVTFGADARCQTATIFGLKTADCQGLGLDELPRGLDRDLKVLKFAENRLPALVADHFRSYPTLQEIYVARNRIASIEAGAFRGILNLQKLDLEANQLAAIRYDFLADARSVRVLNFRYNPIVDIEPGALSNLANLEEINLERCRLTSIDARTFDGLDRLLEINLADNDLVGLPAEMERHLPTGLRVFRFYRNPWRCDCRLRWLRVWTASRAGEFGLGSVGVNWDFARNTPTCAGPRLLRGVSWKLLDPDQFACPAQIAVNSSTSIRVTPGSNASLECAVIGDPAPSVTWYKDSIEVDRNLIETHYDELSATSRVFVVLNDVRIRHTGDYRCVAQNSAGRSEVTFKVWMDHGGSQQHGGGHAVPPDVEVYDANDDVSGPAGGGSSVRLEVAVGAIVGAALIVLVAIIVAVVWCVVRRRRHFQRHHSYNVRDYHQPRGDVTANNNKSSANKSKVIVVGGNGTSRTSKKRQQQRDGSSASKTQQGFARCGGRSDVKPSRRVGSRLPCFRTTPEAEIAASINDDDDDKEDGDGEGGGEEDRGEDGSRQIVVGGRGCFLRDDADDDEVDRFVSSTLQSLLEDKDIVASSAAAAARRHSSTPDRQHRLHWNNVNDDSAEKTAADVEQVAVERDVDKDNDAENRTTAASDESVRHGTDRYAVDKIAVPPPPPRLSGTGPVDKNPNKTTAVIDVAAPAPDLLQDGSGDQHSFLRGSGRSPCSRRAANGAKVSFAIDRHYNDDSNDDGCVETPLTTVVPDVDSVIAAAATRSASLSGLSGRCHAEENEYIVRTPGGDVLVSPSGGRHTSTAAALRDPQSAAGFWRSSSASTTPAAVLLDTPESSVSGCSGYCVGRTSSLGRRIRPAGGATLGRHVTLPPPRHPITPCSYAPTGNGSRQPTTASSHHQHHHLQLQQQHHPSSSAASHSETMTMFKMALPSTIVGVTEGLFMPTAGSGCSAAASGNQPEPGRPRKPVRTYEWRSSSGTRDCPQSEVTSSSSSSTATMSSFKPALKRTQQQQQDPTAASPPSSSSRRKSASGTAV